MDISKLRAAWIGALNVCWWQFEIGSMDREWVD
jgi:hypothetical protein